ncbi:hydroxypyruvate isomerase family protein [Chelatococcus asaccharovorans]|uniref:hydroxypyruvate isomerase family protein n=1 Tax=Chelatococcus asaccharovorans TaxID=28210 RepID=UPI00224C6C1A|nr:TIM barrel protein [Chelatococcus asaccharovorans]CAH1666254.1 Hydroxypyruvate isomerase [Chelatococcus asaccharovorans]CAH1681566.1 Hydroxypyruvate isomerase [Chelatococcus asaccharovorans]
MARFAPNFYHHYLELPVRERFAAARASGFDAIEWHFPYELAADALGVLLDDNGLAFLYAVMPVDWTRDKGLAGLPGREDECRAAAERGLAFLSRIGAGSMQVGAGVVPEGASREHCVEVFQRNLDWICDQARGTGVDIAIEGVCNARFPGWVVQTIGETAEVVRTVNRPNLKLVYDTYHLRMEEKGPLTPLLDLYWPLIGHVQIGNAPGRHEPGVGEIDLFHIIDALEAKGWTRPIGLEFDPASDTWSSLRWMERYGYPACAAPANIKAGTPARPSSV